MSSDTTVIHIGPDGEARFEPREVCPKNGGAGGPLQVHLHTDAVKRKVDAAIKELVSARVDALKMFDSAKPEVSRRIEVAIKSVVAGTEREINLMVMSMIREKLKKTVDEMSLSVDVRGIVGKPTP